MVLLSFNRVFKFIFDSDDNFLFERRAADNLWVRLPRNFADGRLDVSLSLSFEMDLQSAAESGRPVQGVSESQYSLEPFPRWRSWRPSMFFHTDRLTSSDFL